MNDQYAMLIITAISNAVIVLTNMIGSVLILWIRARYNYKDPPMNGK